MIPFRRKTDLHALAVGMASVRMGDHLVQIGCADGARLAAIAAKVGLSGRAVAVVADESSSALVAKGAREQGVLIEIELAPPTASGLDASSFDLAMIDDTQGLFATMSDGDRALTVNEVARILKPGGRAMVIGAAPLDRLSAVFARGKRGPLFDAGPSLMQGGFKAARLLAEREGLRFVEAIKPKSAV